MSVINPTYYNRLVGKQGSSDLDVAYQGARDDEHPGSTGVLNAETIASGYYLHCSYYQYYINRFLISFNIPSLGPINVHSAVLHFVMKVSRGIMYHPCIEPFDISLRVIPRVNPGAITARESFVAALGGTQIEVYHSMDVPSASTWYERDVTSLVESGEWLLFSIVIAPDLAAQRTLSFCQSQVIGTALSGGAYLDIDYDIAIISPTATTEAANNLTQAQSNLNGILTDDGDEACDCWFEWGLTDSYGNTTPIQSGKTTGDVVSQVISGLEAGTVYHFRFVAENSVGTGYGDDRTFVTESPALKEYSLAQPELLLLLRR